MCVSGRSFSRPLPLFFFLLLFFFPLSISFHLACSLHDFWEWLADQGNDLVVQLAGTSCCPQAIIGNMFLTESKIILRPSSNDTNVTGLTITGNLFAGLQRCNHDNARRETCSSVWVDEDIGSIRSFSGSTVSGNSCSGGRYCVGSSASRSLRLVNATQWIVEFGAGQSGGSLLQGLPLSRALYSIAVEDSSFPRHHMLPLKKIHGEAKPAVTVVTDIPTTATVTVEVSQETADVDYQSKVDLAHWGRHSKHGHDDQRRKAGESADGNFRGAKRRSAAELVHIERVRSTKWLARHR